MCKVGDIILVKSYKGVDSKDVGHHSFVVLDDEKGFIEGLPYDIICGVLSSFHSEDHKKKKLLEDGNVLIKNGDTVTNPDNGKDGFLKADQLYYFNKSKLDYEVIGYIREDLLERIISYIESLGFKVQIVIDNL